MKRSYSVLILSLLALAAAARSAGLAGSFGAAQGAAPSGSMAGSMVAVAGTASAAAATGPVLELPDDYSRVLQEASQVRPQASLVVLSIRGLQGEERAFGFAAEALHSGLFSEVGVGDDARSADYAVAGSAWEGVGAPSMPDGAWGACGWTPGAKGLFEWMDLSTSVHLKLARRGRIFAHVDLDKGFDRVRVPLPFTLANEADTVERGLDIAYGRALYRVARDILRREDRP